MAVSNVWFLIFGYPCADHNVIAVTYFAADEAQPLDAIFRQEEGAIDGASALLPWVPVRYDRPSYCSYGCRGRKDQEGDLDAKVCEFLVLIPWDSIPICLA